MFNSLLVILFYSLSCWCHHATVGIIEGSIMEAGGIQDFRILKSRNPEKFITLHEISGFLYVSAYFCRFLWFPEISQIFMVFSGISNHISFHISGFHINFYAWWVYKINFLLHCLVTMYYNTALLYGLWHCQCMYNVLILLQTETNDRNSHPIAHCWCCQNEREHVRDETECCWNERECW